MVIQLIRFGIVGTLITLIDFALFFCLYRFGYHYLFANFIAFIAASVIGYFLSVKFVWQRKATRNNLLGYYLVHILGLASSSILLFFINHLVVIEVAKLLTCCVIPMQTFLLNKFVVFR